MYCLTGNSKEAVTVTTKSNLITRWHKNEAFDSEREGRAVVQFFLLTAADYSCLSAE